MCAFDLNSNSAGKNKIDAIPMIAAGISRNRGLPGKTGFQQWVGVLLTKHINEAEFFKGAGERPVNCHRMNTSRSRLSRPVPERGLVEISGNEAQVCRACSPKVGFEQVQRTPARCRCCGDGFSGCSEEWSITLRYQAGFC